MQAGFRVASAPEPHTYEDDCAIPDDGRRYEHPDGELSVIPPANLSPQRTLRESSSSTRQRSRSLPRTQIVKSRSDGIQVGFRATSAPSPDEREAERRD